MLSWGYQCWRKTYTNVLRYNILVLQRRSKVTFFAVSHKVVLVTIIKLNCTISRRFCRCLWDHYDNEVCANTLLYDRHTSSPRVTLYPLTGALGLCLEGFLELDTVFMSNSNTSIQGKYYRFYPEHQTVWDTRIYFYFLSLIFLISLIKVLDFIWIYIKNTLILFFVNRSGHFASFDKHEGFQQLQCFPAK